MVSETHINRKPGLWNIEVNFLTWKGSSTLITKNRKVGRDIPSSWLLVSEQLTGDSQGFHLLAAHSRCFSSVSQIEQSYRLTLSSLEAGSSPALRANPDESAPDP